MSKTADLLTTLRNMPAEQLRDQYNQQQRKLFEVRVQQATGQVENHRQIRALRKELARILTVGRETSSAHVAEESES
jgi:large subunit ribosomal protein L29